jgi:lysyl-tRNA synthetase class 2
MLRLARRLSSTSRRHGLRERTVCARPFATDESTDRVTRLKDLQNSPHYRHYPNGFQPSVSLKNFADTYQVLDSGARETNLEMTVVGRVVSRRAASKKLTFLHIESGDGHSLQKLQVLSDVKFYAGGDEEFHTVHGAVRRGDIIGVRGFPGKSNKGELSIIPREVQLLAPCTQPLPSDQVRTMVTCTPGDELSI